MNADRPNTRLDEIVAAVTPRVLEEAIDQAVQQARDELASWMTQAIVEHARATTTAEATPAGGSERPDRDAQTADAPAGRAPARQSSETGLYAFAIVGADAIDLNGVPGIDGEKTPRVLQHDGLGLVVSEMRLDLMDDVSESDLSETSALATLARRHDDVVRAAFEQGPVLPLRFGTVVDDDGGARQLLDDYGPAARPRLQAVNSHREWAARLSRDGVAVEDDSTTDRDERRGMTGTSYLAARRERLQRAERAEQETATVAAEVEKSLSAYAVDVAHRAAGAGTGVLADVAYLVPADREDDFLASAERIRRQMAHEGVALEVTGPWPPYSFASLEQGVRAGA